MFSFSLRTKIMALCTLFVAMILIVGATAYLGLQSMDRSYSHVTHQALPRIQALSQMFGTYRGLRIRLLEITLPNLSEEKLKKEYEKTEKLSQGYLEHRTKYLAVPFVTGEETKWQALESGWKSFESIRDQLLALSKQNQPEAKRQYVDQLESIGMQNSENMQKAFADLFAFHEEQARLAVDDSVATKILTYRFLLLVGSLGAVLGLLIGWILASKIAAAIREVSGKINEAAQTTTAASTELAVASQNLSNGASEAAASLEETVASIEELSSIVKQNSSHANEADTLSQVSRSVAEKGDLEIARLIEAIAEMSKSSVKIEEIISVMDNIAFQTNLLALNAAVEAARAGEQGKGFAVVADAVRNLALKSAGAAKEINGLIKDNVALSNRGSAIANSSAMVLQEIVSSVKKVSDLNREIASASGEQSQGLSQISRAMNQLDQATQTNAASSEEVSATAEQISGQAAEVFALAAHLQRLLTGQRTPPPPIILALAFEPARASDFAEKKVSGF